MTVNPTASKIIDRLLRKSLKKLARSGRFELPTPRFVV